MDAVGDGDSESVAGCGTERLGAGLGTCGGECGERGREGDQALHGFLLRFGTDPMLTLARNTGTPRVSRLGNRSIVG